jgi:hypothetical protein
VISWTSWETFDGSWFWLRLGRLYLGLGRFQREDGPVLNLVFHWGQDAGRDG